MKQGPLDLSQHFLEEGVVDLSSSEKQSALEELCAITSKHAHVRDAKAFCKAIFEREKLVSTGIGLGVAIPHVKIPSVTDYVITVGRSEAGIDFDAIDGQPVRLVFMIAASEKQTAEFVRVLASIVKLVKQNDVRSRLLEASMPNEFCSILREASR
ncbi:MAG: PTS sugar transporter subunit IIA [Planctomycetes bacterium]|nr:PTS sugar transporter subunit IIA [Planctomycetota bacterium]